MEWWVWIIIFAIGILIVESVKDPDYIEKSKRKMREQRIKLNKKRIEKEQKQRDKWW